MTARLLHHFLCRLRLLPVAGGGTLMPKVPEGDLHATWHGSSAKGGESAVCQSLAGSACNPLLWGAVMRQQQCLRPHSYE